MVTIDVSIEDIGRLMGIEETLSPTELDELIAYTISEVDSEPDGPDENGHTKISIDVKTSNRPDLWCAEGIARMVRGMRDHPGLPPLDAPPSGYSIEVDAGVHEIRPYIGAAVVRGLELDDFLIKQIIQLQDKVDFSFGRKRKRTSIGIYNINMLSSPIKYTLVDRDFTFQPLGFETKLTVDEIFEKHPKGQEYAAILEPYKQVPMLIDVNDRILSMPPIINSNDVGRVTEDTQDVLVEVTGTNYGATIQALAVVVQALRDRGGEVSSVEIKYPENYEIQEDTTPHSNPLEIVVDPKDINRYLGTNLSAKKMIELLKIRRNNAKMKGKKILVELPPWRRDVLHWVDVSEDIAMAYGYNNFTISKAKVVTAGAIAASTEDENLMRQLFTGMGLIEILNYTLTDRLTISDQVMRDEEWIEDQVIELSNPVSSSFNFIRPDLLPGALRFISRNTHNEYPQRIFETGEVVVKQNNAVITKTKASVVLAGYDETFETILSILDTLTRLRGIEYTLESVEHNYYLSGRSANIMFNGEIAGHLGEVHPQIINNLGVEVPISAMELDLSKIPGLNIKDIYTDKN
ncbi:MAG: phenylalanine--tRNA ligase subunit beta [Candidatus Heimdallarchaeota archaeon]|nr:phenylalanine--tRNA ligase subunit beta [Candidatus Heimdallarchaeota archaeon]